MSRSTMIAVSVFALLYPFAEASAQRIVTERINDSFSFLRANEGSGNTLIFRGSEGTVLVDTMDDSIRIEWGRALEREGIDDVRYAFNTHWHQNHVGGNALIADSAVIIAPSRLRWRLQHDQHLSFLVNRRYPAMSPAHWPELTFDDSVVVNISGERIVAWHIVGHTDTDAIIHFTSNGIVATGDLWTPGAIIPSDVDTGGDLFGVADALRRLSSQISDDVIIVPGHGRPGTRSELLTYVAGLDAVLAYVTEGLRRDAGLRDLLDGEIPAAVREFAGQGAGRMIEAAFRSPTARTIR